MTQAVLEGVAFSLRDCMDALAASGTVVESATAIGGGVAVAGWVGIVAAALGCRCGGCAGGAGGAFGAARLARMAVTGESPEAVCTAPAVEEVVVPEPGLAAAYGERLVRYRALLALARG